MSTLTSIRTATMEVLNGSPKHSVSRYVEWLITCVVLMNCSAVVMDSVPDVHAQYSAFFAELESWSVLFFTAEYLLRVWSLGASYDAEQGGPWKGRREYVFSPFGLVDFVATAPHYLQIFFPALDLRMLRVLRLLRILKLSKYNTALQDLARIVRSESRAFGSAAFLLLMATLVSGSLMYFAEGSEQPKYFGSIPRAIYWSIVTITSGYGNVEPVTKAGEVIALLTGFLGVCVAAIMTGIVASAFTNRILRKKAAYQRQVGRVLEEYRLTDALPPALPIASNKKK